MQLPSSVLKMAASLLQGDVNGKLKNIKSDIKANPRSMPFMEKWGSIVSYLTSSKVPIRKRVLTLGGLLWIILPDPVLGPLDDIIITMTLLPWLNGELENFASGKYDVASSAEVDATERLSFDEFMFSSSNADLTSNPFYISLDEIER
jgi:hypothetical protein